MISFEPTVTLGGLLTGVPMILAIVWGAAVLKTKVETIERKLDSFISRNEAAVLKIAADAEHAAIRREVNGLRQELHAGTG